MNYDLMIQTSYSLNGSLIDVEVLVQKASVAGYKTLGLVDQGVMYAAIKFSEACIAAKIKPIIGLEFPITGVFGKSSTLIAYAKNQNGYQNLIQISSHINTLSTPITLEMLTNWSTGLFFVQSPSKGDFYQTALEQDFDTATYLVGQYNKYLQEWYLGIDLGNFEVETIVAPWYEQLGNTVIINQVSYYQSSDKTAANILSQILKDTISMESGLFTTEAVDQSLLSIEELNTRYKGYEEAILRTKRLIDSITWVIPIGQRHLPKYPLLTDELPSVFLSRLARRGLDRRYVQMTRPKATFDVYLNRLLFELSMIEKMGYEDYFLIVWDFVLFAKRSQILVGPGRGSAAGSLVSYVLGIVDVDPLEHGLFFERFLNPERITMPDIDMDFPDDRRDEVIRYVVDKYGKNHVTNIVAFGTFQGKSAIRDVGRILKMPDSTLSEISEYLSSTNNSIQDFIQDQPQKYHNLIENKEVAFLFEVSSKLINLPKHIGTHAAGIIITQENVLAYSPVQNGLLDMYQTQYEAADLERIGLNKIDFLGIRNLKTIQKVVELIKETTSEVVDVYKIPFDDSKTFSLLQDVHSLGIFQLESDGMMNLMRKMQLTTFDDISLCIALFRPGPMENIPTYLKRRFHQEKVEYLHPILQPILEGTKGVIVYQEQIMQIARDFANYSLGEADVLRRAVSKKSDAILQAERSKFVSKSLKQGHSEHIANEIYDYIVK
ncbi:MAG: DNA polymerase III subunit alpha, partial [Candidatus Izemoplasmatales bacterium]|nr:DNA polymerase III subunit alpha [Candidatus Izemoplasmatales bacterium]